jgi:hypothetical protein
VCAAAVMRFSQQRIYRVFYVYDGAAAVAAVTHSALRAEEISYTNRLIARERLLQRVYGIIFRETCMLNGLV